MSNLVGFGSVAIGQFFVWATAPFDPKSMKTHKVFLKVDALQYQEGERIPTRRKITMPLNMKQHQNVRRDDLMVYLVEDRPPFKLTRL